MHSKRPSEDARAGLRTHSFWSDNNRIRFLRENQPLLVQCSHGWLHKNEHKHNHSTFSPVSFFYLCQKTAIWQQTARKKGGKMQDIGLLAVIPSNNLYKSRLTMVVLRILKSPFLLVVIPRNPYCFKWHPSLDCAPSPPISEGMCCRPHGSPPQNFRGAGRRAVFSAARKWSTLVVPAEDFMSEYWNLVQGSTSRYTCTRSHHQMLLRLPWGQVVLDVCSGGWYQTSQVLPIKELVIRILQMWTKKSPSYIWSCINIFC
jgi:hypothetical protein